MGVKLRAFWDMMPCTLFWQQCSAGTQKVPWKIGNYQPAQHDSQKTITLHTCSKKGIITVTREKIILFKFAFIHKNIPCNGFEKYV